MNEVLKYLGGLLRRSYGAIVDTPMPWRMIDKLASLEEREEEKLASSSHRPQTDTLGKQEKDDERRPQPD